LEDKEEGSLPQPSMNYKKERKSRSKKLEIATLVLTSLLVLMVGGYLIYGSISTTSIQNKLDHLLPQETCQSSCNDRCLGSNEEGEAYGGHSSYDECFRRCTGTGTKSPSIHFKLVNTGYSTPQAIRFGRVPGDRGDLPKRMFVASQHGMVTLTNQNHGKGGPQIRIVNLATVVGQGGLTGLELHPHFHHNGRFYLWYSIPRIGGGVNNTPNCSADGGYGSSGASNDRRNFGQDRTYDPDIYTDLQVLEEYHLQSAHHNATLVSRLLTVKHFFSTHYGSDTLRFDENGNLLVYVSDGGCHYDQFGVGQDRAFLPGKVLSVEVGPVAAVGFDCSEPAAQWSELTSSCPPITLYASGCRDGGHLSLDQYNGLWNRYLSCNGEANQDAVYRFRWESNFGWVRREGQLCTCVADDPLIDPVCDFNQSVLDCNALVTSITGSYTEPLVAINYRSDHVNNTVGGFVYRGGDLACSLRGRYIWGTNDGRGVFHLYSTDPTSLVDDVYGRVRLVSGLSYPTNYLSVFGYDEETGRLYIGTQPTTSPYTNGGQPITSGQIFLLTF
jgi:hypothetical protein